MKILLLIFALPLLTAANFVSSGSHSAKNTTVKIPENGFNWLTDLFNWDSANATTGSSEFGEATTTSMKPLKVGAKRNLTKRKYPSVTNIIKKPQLVVTFVTNTRTYEPDPFFEIDPMQRFMQIILSSVIRDMFQTPRMEYGRRHVEKRKAGTIADFFKPLVNSTAKTYNDTKKVFTDFGSNVKDVFKRNATCTSCKRCLVKVKRNYDEREELLNKTTRNPDEVSAKVTPMETNEGAREVFFANKIGAINDTSGEITADMVLNAKFEYLGLKRDIVTAGLKVETTNATNSFDNGTTQVPLAKEESKPHYFLSISGGAGKSTTAQEYSDGQFNSRNVRNYDVPIPFRIDGVYQSKDAESALHSPQEDSGKVARINSSLPNDIILNNGHVSTNTLHLEALRKNQHIYIRNIQLPLHINPASTHTTKSENVEENLATCPNTRINQRSVSSSVITQEQKASGEEFTHSPLVFNNNETSGLDLFVNDSAENVEDDLRNLHLDPTKIIQVHSDMNENDETKELGDKIWMPESGTETDPSTEITSLPIACNITRKEASRKANPSINSNKIPNNFEPISESELNNFTPTASSYIKNNTDSQTAPTSTSITVKSREITRESDWSNFWKFLHSFQGPVEELTDSDDTEAKRHHFLSISGGTDKRATAFENSEPLKRFARDLSNEGFGAALTTYIPIYDRNVDSSPPRDGDLSVLTMSTLLPLITRVAEEEDPEYTTAATPIEFSQVRGSVLFYGVPTTDAGISPELGTPIYFGLSSTDTNQLVQENNNEVFTAPYLCNAHLTDVTEAKGECEPYHLADTTCEGTTLSYTDVCMYDNLQKPSKLKVIGQHKYPDRTTMPFHCQTTKYHRLHRFDAPRIYYKTQQNANNDLNYLHLDFHNFPGFLLQSPYAPRLVCKNANVQRMVYPHMLCNCIHTQQQPIQTTTHPVEIIQTTQNEELFLNPVPYTQQCEFNQPSYTTSQPQNSPPLQYAPPYNNQPGGDIRYNTVQTYNKHCKNDVTCKYKAVKLQNKSRNKQPGVSSNNGVFKTNNNNNYNNQPSFVQAPNSFFNNQPNPNYNYNAVQRPNSYFNYQPEYSRVQMPGYLYNYPNFNAPRTQNSYYNNQREPECSCNTVQTPCCLDDIQPIIHYNYGGSQNSYYNNQPITEINYNKNLNYTSQPTSNYSTSTSTTQNSSESVTSSTCKNTLTTSINDGSSISPGKAKNKKVTTSGATTYCPMETTTRKAKRKKTRKQKTTLTTRTTPSNTTYPLNPSNLNPFAKEFCGMPENDLEDENAIIEMIRGNKVSKPRDIFATEELPTECTEMELVEIPDETKLREQMYGGKIPASLTTSSYDMPSLEKLKERMYQKFDDSDERNKATTCTDSTICSDSVLDADRISTCDESQNEGVTIKQLYGLTYDTGTTPIGITNVHLMEKIFYDIMSDTTPKPITFKPITIIPPSCVTARCFRDKQNEFFKKPFGRVHTLFPKEDIIVGSTALYDNPAFRRIKQFVFNEYVTQPSISSLQVKKILCDDKMPVQEACCDPDVYEQILAYYNFAASTPNIEVFTPGYIECERHEERTNRYGKYSTTKRPYTNMYKIHCQSKLSTTQKPRMRNNCCQHRSSSYGTSSSTALNFMDFLESIASGSLGSSDVARSSYMTCPKYCVKHAVPGSDRLNNSTSGFVNELVKLLNGRHAYNGKGKWSRTTHYNSTSTYVIDTTTTVPTTASTNATITTSNTASVTTRTVNFTLNHNGNNYNVVAFLNFSRLPQTTDSSKLSYKDNDSRLQLKATFNSKNRFTPGFRHYGATTPSFKLEVSNNKSSQLLFRISSDQVQAIASNVLVNVGVTAQNTSADNATSTTVSYNTSTTISPSTNTSTTISPSTSYDSTMSSQMETTSMVPQNDTSSTHFARDAGDSVQFLCRNGVITNSQKRANFRPNHFRRYRNKLSVNRNTNDIKRTINNRRSRVYHFTHSSGIRSIKELDGKEDKTKLNNLYKLAEKYYTHSIQSNYSRNVTKTQNSFLGNITKPTSTANTIFNTTRVGKFIRILNHETTTTDFLEYLACNTTKGKQRIKNRLLGRKRLNNSTTVKYSTRRTARTTTMATKLNTLQYNSTQENLKNKISKLFKTKRQNITTVPTTRVTFELQDMQNYIYSPSSVVQSFCPPMTSLITRAMSKLTTSQKFRSNKNNTSRKTTTTSNFDNNKLSGNTEYNWNKFGSTGSTQSETFETVTTSSKNTKKQKSTTSGIQKEIKEEIERKLSLTDMQNKDKKVLSKILSKSNLTINFVCAPPQNVNNRTATKSKNLKRIGQRLMGYLHSKTESTTLPAKLSRRFKPPTNEKPSFNEGNIALVRLRRKYDAVSFVQPNISDDNSSKNENDSKFEVSQVPDDEIIAKGFDELDKLRGVLKQRNRENQTRRDPTGENWRKQVTTEPPDSSSAEAARTEDDGNQTTVEEEETTTPEIPPDAEMDPINNPKDKMENNTLLLLLVVTLTTFLTIKREDEDYDDDVLDDDYYRQYDDSYNGTTYSYDDDDVVHDMRKQVTTDSPVTPPNAGESQPGDGGGQDTKSEPDEEEDIIDGLGSDAPKSTSTAKPEEGLDIDVMYLLIIFLPTFIILGGFIVVMCYVLRLDGACCKLFVSVETKHEAVVHKM